MCRVHWHVERTDIGDREKKLSLEAIHVWRHGSKSEFCNKNRNLLVYHHWVIVDNERLTVILDWNSSFSDNSCEEERNLTKCNYWMLLLRRIYITSHICLKMNRKNTRIITIRTIQQIPMFPMGRTGEGLQCRPCEKQTGPKLLTFIPFK